MRKIIIKMIGAIIVGVILGYSLDLSPMVGGLLGGGFYYLSI